MILMNNFQAEPEALILEELSAVERVIRSGWYVLGGEVEAFEKKWSELLGLNHAIGVGNGMDAIEISLRASGIQPGDEVITTSMTAFASVLAIIRCGAIPVLADVDLNTGLMSFDSVVRCISFKTRAILLVHLYGQIRGISSWVELCSKYNLVLIEDCAQAHLSKSQGVYAGGFGVAGAFSFYPTKNLGCLGDGGMIVSNSANIANQSVILRNYGQAKRYYHSELGLNSRLDEIQAAILSVRMKWLSAFTEARRNIAYQYLTRVNNPIISMPSPPEDDQSHVYHLFVICAKDRDKLQAFLLAEGIQTYIHYPVPIHWQKACPEILTDPNGLLQSEKYSSNCLSLPCHPQMTQLEIDQVVTALNKFS